MLLSFSKGPQDELKSMNSMNALNRLVHLSCFSDVILAERKKS